MYVYIYIYAHVYNRLYPFIDIDFYGQSSPQYDSTQGSTDPSDNSKVAKTKSCLFILHAAWHFLTHWAIRIHWIKSGSLGIPPKIREFSMETTLSGIFGKFHPSGYYVHHLEKMRHVLSRHPFFTMSCHDFQPPPRTVTRLVPPHHP